MGKKTIQTLLDLLNPLHGALDKRTMDLREENYPADFCRDDEIDVIVTRGMERDLTQAVSILENRLTTADDLIDTVEAMQSFIGIMFGQGPDAIIPETVNAPIGIPIKVGDLMRSVSAIVARAKA